jgi:hypothetical protein
MTARKPDDMLKRTQALENAMNKAKNRAVFVGLPSEKVGGEIYGNKKNPQTIMTIGAIHEYGAGDNPKRSYLRTPFIMHKKKINEFIANQFEKTTNGKSVDDALNLVGAFCRNISVKAFSTKGYGQWEDLEPETIRRKGSSKPLIDTGTLRNAITWVIRND